MAQGLSSSPEGHVLPADTRAHNAGLCVHASSLIYPPYLDVQSLKAPWKYSSTEIREQKCSEQAGKEVLINETSLGSSKHFLAEYITVSAFLPSLLHKHVHNFLVTLL